MDTWTVRKYLSILGGFPTANQHIFSGGLCPGGFWPGDIWSCNTTLIQNALLVLTSCCHINLILCYNFAKLASHAIRAFACWKLPHLCKSAVSVVEFCSLPSHDSDRLYGLSKTLVERSRVANEDDSGRCCGEANGDAPPTGAVIDSMTVGDDELLLASLRRVDSRLMNDVLCLKRWHDDVLTSIDTSSSSVAILLDGWQCKPA